MSRKRCVTPSKTAAKEAILFCSFQAFIFLLKLLYRVYGGEYVVLVPLQQGGRICQVSGRWRNCAHTPQLARMATSSHPPWTW